MGKIPYLWLESIISPIPKSSNKDFHVPLNYVELVFYHVLKSILEFIEHAYFFIMLTNGCFNNEQNGFRQDR